MKVCPSCKVRYSDDNQFCSRCGKSLVEEAYRKQSFFKYWQNFKILQKVVILGSLIGLIAIGVFLFLNKRHSKIYPANQQPSIKVLTRSQVDSLVDNYLDKDLLANKKKSSAISINNKIYLLVVTEKKGIGETKLYEIQYNLPINYKIKGDLPVYGGNDDTLVTKDITGDGIPEFIYYSSVKVNNNRVFIWTIINLTKRETAEGDYTISSEIYSNNHISLNSVADDNDLYKDYILSQIAFKKNEIYAEEGNNSEKDSIYKLLIDFWIKNNGIACSELDAPCKIKLLWLYFDSDSGIINLKKNAEVENDKYKIIAMSKEGVYLIDKQDKKMALIYLPEDSASQITKIKMVGDKVVLYRDSKRESSLPVVFDIKETSLKKVKNINQEEEE